MLLYGRLDEEERLLSGLVRPSLTRLRVSRWRAGEHLQIGDLLVSQQVLEQFLRGNDLARTKLLE